MPFLNRCRAGRHEALPPFAAEVIGRRPVAAITRHTDRTHAAGLAMIDELLAMGHDNNGSNRPDR